MNVLFFATDFNPNPGGIATFLHNLAVQLVDLGHQVDVLTPKRSGSAAADAGQPYRVYRYGATQRLSSLVPTLRTLGLHRRRRYDCAFVGHVLTTHALGVWALLKLEGVPYAILSHGNDLRYSVTTKADVKVARSLLGNARLILANSRFTADHIRQAGHRRPIGVLNPGVDEKQFHPDVDTTQVRQVHGLNGHRTLITAARLVAKKNVGAVLRALSTVVERVPDVLYLIAMQYTFG